MVVWSCVGSVPACLGPLRDLSRPVWDLSSHSHQSVWGLSEFVSKWTGECGQTVFLSFCVVILSVHLSCTWEKMDGGWIDAWMNDDGSINVWMEGWMGEWLVNGCMGGWMINGWRWMMVES